MPRSHSSKAPAMRNHHTKFQNIGRDAHLAVCSVDGLAHRLLVLICHKRTSGVYRGTPQRASGQNRVKHGDDHNAFAASTAPLRTGQRRALTTRAVWTANAFTLRWRRDRLGLRDNITFSRPRIAHSHCPPSGVRACAATHKDMPLLVEDLELDYVAKAGEGDAQLLVHHCLGHVVQEQVSDVRRVQIVL